MAAHRSHILDLARKGAEHRYEELKAELVELVKDFPHLARRTGRIVSRGASSLSRRGRAFIAAGGDALLQPKRRKMSAKARKAISDAQKRRWAAQKSATAAETPVRKAAKKR
jgi:hypothetical protein